MLLMEIDSQSYDILVDYVGFCILLQNFKDQLLRMSQRDTCIIIIIIIIIML